MDLFNKLPLENHQGQDPCLSSSSSCPPSEFPPAALPNLSEASWSLGTRALHAHSAGSGHRTTLRSCTAALGPSTPEQLSPPRAHFHLSRDSQDPVLALGAPGEGNPAGGRGQAFPHAHCSVCRGLKTDLPSRRAQLNPKWKTDSGQLASRPAAGIKATELSARPSMASGYQICTWQCLSAHSPGGRADPAKPRGHPAWGWHDALGRRAAASCLGPAARPFFKCQLCAQHSALSTVSDAAPARRGWSAPALRPQGRRWLPTV